MMPFMTGTEVVQGARKDPRIDSVPIVKPFALSRLLAMVEDVVGRPRGRPAAAPAAALSHRLSGFG